MFRKNGPRCRRRDKSHWSRARGRGKNFPLSRVPGARSIARAAGRPPLSEQGSASMDSRPNLVLVHGAWADGSSWTAVIERLQASGYRVTAPQMPLTSLSDNVARLRQVLDRQTGPTLLVGHSYGCQIITALGPHAPNVVGLVYIAGFGLDEGESIGQLLAQG